MFSIVYITTGSMEEAKQIARRLVNEKLAACVNMFPITSIYRWDGIQEDNEVAMIIKTTHEQLQNIEITVKEMHSYTVPCIISFSIDGGSRDYLDWIDDCVLPVRTIRKDDISKEIIST
jgi:periplasmic divalent cation tolerance protein